MLAAMLAVTTGTQANEMNKGCTLSPELPDPTPVDFLLEPLVTGVFTVDIVTPPAPPAYEFLGAGPPVITGEGFVWTQITNTLDKWVFKVTNTKWESAHTKVSLTARWKLKNQEGGGGGGGGSGIISRTGVGNADADAGELIVSADPSIVAVGAEATVSASASDAGSTPALSDWTVDPSPPADFVGLWAGVSSVKVRQYVPGAAEVMAFYCENPEKNAGATVTFVAVTSLSASPNVTPIGNSNIAYTITTDPADHTNMVTLTPADCGTAGSNIATAVCGTSTATCYVTVVKVKTLEYKLGAIDWTAMTSTAYSADGQSVSFRALPDPTNAAWPSGKPLWSTNVTANGSEAGGAFNAPGTNTVSVECGNTASGVVVPLKITITPAATNIAANGGSAVFWLTNSSVGPGGVSWSINPTNGVALNPAADHVTVTPDGSTGLTYTVTAQCVDNTNVNCQATLAVLKVESIEASSTVADNSPQQFEGHQTDFGDPCDPDDPGQALVVFHKDVRDEDFVVQDYDVTLKANILPSSITADQLSENWAKVEGPASGGLNHTDTFEVKYQNAKEGGLYQFEFDLGLSGCAKSGANLLLPLGGPDVTAYYLSEAQRYDTWLSTMKARVNAQTTNDFAAGFIIISYFTKTVIHMNHKYGTYEAGLSPCKPYCDNTVTISGYVFGKDHVGNFLFSYLAARTGFTFGATQLGAKLAAALQGQVDLPDDQAAYEAGYAHGQYPSGDFQAILESKDIDAMQNETAKKGWPSTDTATGSTYPTWGATHGGLDNPD